MTVQPQYTMTYSIADPREPGLRHDIGVCATREEVAALVRDGYMIGHDWFTREQIERYRNAVDRLLRHEPFKSDARVDHYGGWRYFRYLLDKDTVFHDLIRVIPPMTVAQAVLGPLVRLDHVDAKYGLPDVAGQYVPWHMHHRVIPDPLPPLFSFPHAIHCLLYLDDLDEANGCLCVVPGSHARPGETYIQDENGDREGQLVLSVRAGDCVLLHSNMLHRVLSSRPNGAPRRLILFGYLPAWMQAGERGDAPAVRLTDEVRRTGDALTCQLLGEFYWG